MGGARFSAPVPTIPGAHPAAYTMGTGSFQGVKRPGRGVTLTTHIHLLQGLKKNRAKPLLPSLSFDACSGVSFTSTFTSFWCIKNSYHMYGIAKYCRSSVYLCVVSFTRWIYKALRLYYLVCRAYLERTATPYVNKTHPFNANTQNALAHNNNFVILT